MYRSCCPSLTDVVLWVDNHPLHWPLIDSKDFRVRLAKAEMEKKVQDDAKRYLLQDPNARTQSELQVIRSFKRAAEEIYRLDGHQRRYDHRLGRFYMWENTAACIVLAVHVPTGYADRKLRVECCADRLLVQSEGSFPVIDRCLDVSLEHGDVKSYASIDNRYHVFVLPKAQQDAKCARLFIGDSDGCRCLEPIYDLYDTDDEVLLELKVPFWIDAEDVHVEFSKTKVEIWVRNHLYVARSFWTELECIAADRKETTPAIDAARSSWCLEDVCVANGGRLRVIAVSLIRPDPTESEIRWKRGVRQDNKTQKLPSRQSSGVRFFADDEDAFELEDLLQAACLSIAGQTWVPPKPWETRSGFRATQLAELSIPAQQSYKQLFNQ